MLATGSAFTVTAAVAELAHPLAPVPVTVYIVFVVVEEVTVEPVVVESPVAGDHT
jgi:hypothetical protein